MTGNELRKIFLDYFRGKDHEIIPSLSLIPPNDPTLLFTNAGMVQFKNVFLGTEKKPYKRVATCQKCMRAGGKHNDLEVVGKTAKHHTFFEMLGNFSFGDYFKEGAITMAWEFLTEIVHLPKESLWITIYKDDDEAFKIWHEKIGIKTDRIVRLGEKDNFWSMGETGPCGPCSELHIDRGSDKGCGKDSCSVECSCDRFVEIWNLVFMQYDRDDKGTLTPLPCPCIDTGMGLERLTNIVQGVESNYDTDLFFPLIKNLKELVNENNLADKTKQVAFRVIADHIRAMTFLISDGVIPANEGRSYVLRRIIRRASRFGRVLGKKEPFLYLLSGTVIDLMKNAYPELTTHRDYISRIILNEELGFSNTLEIGTNLLEELITVIKTEKKSFLTGKEAFKLYDTYGFPLDLTQEILADNNLSLDLNEYQQAMEEQKEKARQSWKGGKGKEEINPVYQKLSNSKTEFLGYDFPETTATLLSLIKQNTLIDQAKEGDTVELIFKKTPFYAESGGQVGDQGKIFSTSGLVEITDTFKPIPDLFVHKGIVKWGEIKSGETYQMVIDPERRQKIAANHTATHLLHAALRQVLGEHVKQGGSLVSEDRLRFDFSHFAPLQKREIERVEEIVNEKIRENISIDKNEMAIKDALKTGAMALFGEKYGEKVRLISVGGYSKELCGGTHLKATGEIGVFKITSESAIAAGVRRIEAISGAKAYDYFKNKDILLLEINQLLKTRPGEELEKLKKILEELKDKEKQIEKEKQKKLSQKFSKDELDKKFKIINGINVLTLKLENLNIEGVRSFSDQIKNWFPTNSLSVIAGIEENNVSLICIVSKDLSPKFHAGKIIKEISSIVEGSGGGRPDMAQGGGKNPQKIDQALNQIYILAEKIQDE